MLNSLWTAMNWAWKILGLAGGWMLFWYIIRHGKDTFRELFETISMWIEALCYKLKRGAYQKMAKERTKYSWDNDKEDYNW